MRFLFCDRILALEPGRRALARKTVAMGEAFWPGDSSRQPRMPATLMLECLAQVGGWLYIVTENFGVRTVLGMAEGVRVRRRARAGEVLLLEARFEYRHRDGATIAGEVRSGDEVLLEAGRLMFASDRIQSPEEIASSRQLFAQVTVGSPADRIAP